MRDESIGSSASEKFVVRLPKGMRRAIADTAKRNRRSMNSEIVAIIDRALGELVQQVGANDADALPALVTRFEYSLLQRVRTLTEQKRRAVYELLD